jgi:hypothetical protein
MPAKSMFSEEIFCSSFFSPDNKTDYCNGGLSNITVLLFNSSATKLLDYTLTDINGNFYFKNLPYGSYVVDAEKAGYITNPSSQITLSTGHKHETGVILELTDNKIGVYLSRKEEGSLSLNVFPNPAGNVLNIAIPEYPHGIGEMKIYNSTGQLVYHQEVKQDSNQSKSPIKADISNLIPGIYYGILILETASPGFTFIKK